MVGDKNVRYISAACRRSASVHVDNTIYTLLDSKCGSGNVQLSVQEHELPVLSGYNLLGSRTRTTHDNAFNASSQVLNAGPKCGNPILVSTSSGGLMRQCDYGWIPENLRDLLGEPKLSCSRNPLGFYTRGG